VLFGYLILLLRSTWFRGIIPFIVQVQR